MHFDRRKLRQRNARKQSAFCGLFALRLRSLKGGDNLDTVILFFAMIGAFCFMFPAIMFIVWAICELKTANFRIRDFWRKL